MDQRGADASRSVLRSSAAFATLIVIAALVAGWLVLTSSLFAVDRIDVRGAHHVDAGRVRALARVPSDANLFRLSLDEIAGRVAADPWVARADASRDLPSTLVIRVVERRPAGWVHGRRSALVVARDGTVLEMANPPPDDLPALGSGPTGLEPGERLDPLVELRVAASMPSAVRVAIRSVVTRRGEVVARLRRGGEVRYGEAELLPEKHRALRSILEWADREGIPLELVDVGVPSAPTLLPAGGDAVAQPVPTGSLAASPEPSRP